MEGVVEDTDVAPTAQSYEVFDDLSAQLQTQLDHLHKVETTGIEQFNKLVRDQNIPGGEHAAAERRAGLTRKLRGSGRWGPGRMCAGRTGPLRGSGGPTFTGIPSSRTIGREVNGLMPLSGEAIRLMNLVDDVATTMRRILALVPTLAPEERKRVSEYLKNSEPSTETVQQALSNSK